MGLQRIVVSPAQIQGTMLSLTAGQQHYLQRVLRLRTGDSFIALDGGGQHWLATLTPEPAQAQLVEAIASAISARPLRPITLAAALPKQGFDEVVRQATELGVQCIVPILSDRTVLRPSPQKHQRWQRIAAEAAEQSERAIVPTVQEPMPWRDWLTQGPAASDRFLCVARNRTAPLITAALSAQKPEILIATGAEGGWTSSEVEAAIAADYLPVSLGQTILRAVTASVIAVGILQAVNELVKIDPQFAS